MTAITSSLFARASLEFPFLFAQVNIDSQIESFIAFLSKILLLIALVMVVYGGWQIHDGKIREGAFALTGAFILAVAVLIVKALFAMGGAR